MSSQLDIIPTLLDFAGVPVSENLEGISLRPACTDPQAKTKPYVHGYLCYQGRILTMTLNDSYKLCTFSTERGGGIKLDLGRAAELYDRRNDPGERHDIFGKVDNEDVRRLLDRHVAYFANYAQWESWVKTNDPVKTNIPPRPREKMKIPSGDWFADFSGFLKDVPLQ